MNDLFEQVFKDLCDTQNLVREKGLENLISLLNKKKVDENVCEAIGAFLDEFNGLNFSQIYGNLLFINTILNHCPLDTIYTIKISHICQKFLFSSEVKIRNKAGEILAKVCPNDDTATNHMIDLLFKSTHNMGVHDLYGNIVDTEEFKDIKSNNWMFIESTLNFIVHFINNYNSAKFIKNSIINEIFILCGHSNRFIREICFVLINDILSCKDTIPNVAKLAPKICHILESGLSDNWSQVRYAASKASRTFLLDVRFQSNSTFQQKLLPYICLNRYYLAEGVRIYSQETWNLVTKSEGKHLVERYIEDFIDCYIRATGADNHAVREAGCHCIAELANKINSHILEPYAIKLINILIECFKDDSWPVRDTACLASGSLIAQFPTLSEPFMDTFYENLFQNLGDSIYSVRQGAATSLAKIAQTYGQPSLNIMQTRMIECFDDVAKQRDVVYENAASTYETSLFGVTKTRIAASNPNKLKNNLQELKELSCVEVNDNKMAKLDISDLKHTDQTMFSCGSLAPKMHKAPKIGCHDTSFLKPSQYWEKADGCVYLLTEIVKLMPTDASVKELVNDIFPALMKSLTYRKYAQHTKYFDNFLKNLMAIALSAFTKTQFKNHLNEILPHIFYALDDDNYSLSLTARTCLHQIAQYIGPNILKGRIELIDPGHLVKFGDMIF